MQYGYTTQTVKRCGHTYLQVVSWSVQWHPLMTTDLLFALKYYIGLLPPYLARRKVENKQSRRWYNWIVELNHLVQGYEALRCDVQCLWMIGTSKDYHWYILLIGVSPCLASMVIPSSPQQSHSPTSLACPPNSSVMIHNFPQDGISTQLVCLVATPSLGSDYASRHGK